MSSGISGKAQLRNELGVRIDRPAANLPASTTGNLFQVAGGRVLVTTITGLVTTVIQAQANAIKIQAANAGATLVTDLCATVDSNGAIVGTLFGITGVFASAAILGAGAPQPNAPLVINTGFIRLSAAATNTGQMSWSVTYIPLDDGATLVAV